ncbi:MAG: nucleotidyl transferase AbiEii/AbiGii toxin family protein [Oscillospiraceae bacterium]|nr:nucleotidyl transferase AbiEii/AbiGii toxin family protein [Oscillospiraceae bacterium]
MKLHEDKSVFYQVLEDTAKYMEFVDTGIVEKDYFVTYFLKKIIEKQPNVIFKGGTSLSKCYKIIKRFSEDIDLNIDTKAAKLTEGQRKRLKQDIVSIIEESGFSLENAGQIRSRRDFNRYMIDYHSKDSNVYLNQYLIVETAVYIKSFPTQTMEAASLVYDFLMAKSGEKAIEEYDLKPFNVRVQSLERTFIDKVFAIADYYLNGHIKNHSRHLYDIYKLYPKIIFNNEFAELVREVREVREPHSTCLSAQVGIDVPKLLQRILTEKVYESDYNQITGTLLFENVPYAEAIKVIQEISHSGYFEY